MEPPRRRRSRADPRRSARGRHLQAHPRSTETARPPRGSLTSSVRWARMKRDRHRRCRLRRTPARAGVRRGRRRARFSSTSTRPGRRDQPRREPHRGRPEREPRPLVEAGALAATTDYDAVRDADVDPDRAPDAAHAQPRARPVDRARCGHASSRSGSGQATSSCSNRRPTPERPARRFCRSSRRAASRSGRTSTSPSRPNESIRAAPTGRRRRRRRSSAA